MEVEVMSYGHELFNNAHSLQKIKIVCIPYSCRARHNSFVLHNIILRIFMISECRGWEKAPTLLDLVVGSYNRSLSHDIGCF